MKVAFELTVFFLIIVNYFQGSFGHGTSEVSCGKPYNFNGFVANGKKLTRGDFPWLLFQFLFGEQNYIKQRKLQDGRNFFQKR